MSNGAINLPIVIQQSGDVSRVQEQTQRVGEQQQMAAGAEMVRDQTRAREAVQSGQRGAAGARLRARDQRRQDEGAAGGRSGGREGENPGGPGSPEERDGGLVDVVV